jgi:hypothetical protein
MALHARRRAGMALMTVMAAIAGSAAAGATEPQGFLETLHHQTTLASSVPDNGDQNPYAVVVAPVSAGLIHKDDVLVTNFNDDANLQGRGTTIVLWRPGSRQTTVFAKLPRQLAGCPGGVGLGTAMVMLKTGWVIVGSTPSRDGTTATLGAGCLVVIDPSGTPVGALGGAHVDGPWGNMAWIDRGATATLFVSNAGIDVGAPADDAPVVNKANVLRLELAIPDGQPPHVTAQTVVADGLGEQADKGVFLIGPTGLALAPDGTLYVSDAIGNRITAVADAPTRGDSAGAGREVTRDGFLKRPLAMAMAPNGHLLVTNGLNGEVVEIDPASGRQLYGRWIDTDRAQTPPGNGDLFGLAMTPSGDGVYFVEDDVNTLVLTK